MPRLPKRPELRARRNKASTAATLSTAPKPAVKARLPDLPKVNASGEEWHERSAAWWREIWLSPMAAEWLDSDREQLYMALELVDQFWCHPSAGTIRELRAMLAAFGLDPISRRRLDWRMKKPGEGDAASGGKRTPERNPGAPRTDPRGILSAV